MARAITYAIRVTFKDGREAFVRHGGAFGRGQIMSFIASSDPKFHQPCVIVVGPVPGSFTCETHGTVGAGYETPPTSCAALRYPYVPAPDPKRDAKLALIHELEIAYMMGDDTRRYNALRLAIVYLKEEA